MPLPDDRAHANRLRAESFGEVAQAYDEIRPDYPTALIDDLMALAPASVLDVGTGTGKLATQLAARGLDVLGVEIDERMAAVARARGIQTEVGRFEDWAARGRRFDLITCAQAWHWIDAGLGAPKAHGLLRPGGSLVLAWNFAGFDAATQRALDRAYAAAAPQLSRESVSRGGGPAGIPTYLGPLERAGFAPVEHRRYPWQRTYTTDEWLALVGTHSDHTTLPGPQLATLLTSVAAAIDSLGGSLVAEYVTEVLVGAGAAR